MKDVLIPFSALFGAIAVAAYFAYKVVVESYKEIDNSKISGRKKLRSEGEGKPDKPLRLKPKTQSSAT